MKLKENAKYDIAAVSSMGVRITPEHRQPVHTSNLFKMQATSAESNVLNISASLGKNALVLTKFVSDNAIATYIKGELRKRNINYVGKDVPSGGPWGYRHQFNIADSGYGLRGPIVTNDRAGEVGRTISAEDFDLEKIFKDEKEPLYGRNTGELKVKPFRPSVLKQIMADAKPDYSKEDLLAMFSFTGGVAKYVNQLVDAGALDKDAMIRYIVSANSTFLNEGKNNLIEEFGKDYGTYFSILSCIARGKNTRNEIEDVIGKEVGGYLTNLENDYELIAKRQPLFEKSGNKNVRYELGDVFYSFWFRFVFKYSYIIEIENYAKLQEIIMRDYNTFSGLMLERYFHRVAMESEEFTRIGRWWDRKGENEIDMIAEDELSDRAMFFEIKRQKEDISLGVLKQKAEVFLQATGQFKGYRISYKGLSMQDM